MALGEDGTPGTGNGTFWVADRFGLPVQHLSVGRVHPSEFMALVPDQGAAVCLPLPTLPESTSRILPIQGLPRGASAHQDLIVLVILRAPKIKLWASVHARCECGLLASCLPFP